MSLFKAKELWQTQCGEGEEFDLRSLCIGNVDNSANGETKIIVGSLQGFIRVYNAQHKGYRLEHLMLEVRTKFDIAGSATAYSRQRPQKA